MYLIDNSMDNITTHFEAIILIKNCTSNDLHLNLGSYLQVELHVG